MLRKVRGLAGLCLLCTNLSQSIAINCAPNRPLIQRDQVTHGECDGVLDLHEFEDALKEAGLDVGHYLGHHHGDNGAVWPVLVRRGWFAELCHIPVKCWEYMQCSGWVNQRAAATVQPECQFVAWVL